MTVLSAHQPSFWPWPGLLDKLRQADLFVILDHLHLTRQDWTVRNRIKTQNGEQMLTVPTLGPDSQPLRDVELAEGNWRRKHLRALELAYGKAPFWLRYQQDVCAAYGDYDTLVSLDTYTTLLLASEFGIETPVVYSSDLVLEGATKNDLLIRLCQMFEADAFVFGGNGRDYADESLFLKAGIKPIFQDYHCRPYPQLHGKFIPGLSALDLLLNLGPAGRDYL